MLFSDDSGLVYLFHPFPGFEWDVSQVCLPLLPCNPFLEVLSGVYAGLISHTVSCFGTFNL